MAFVIAVANEKGGVAKTTTAVSLGGALVEAGRDVLLVDLDAQANLTLAMGLNPSKIHRSITNVLMNSASPITASRETNIPGLDLIPSNAEMSLAERFLPIRQNYQTMLRNALTGVQAYNYILLDCPPSLGAVTTNALVAANLLVIPTQAEYFSVYALRGTIAAVKRIRTQFNAQLDYRILITMLDLRNRIHRTLTDQLNTAFGERLFHCTIETDTKLRESPIAGVPITHYLTKSRSAMQYRSLAEELIKYAEQ